ncbi:MAG: RNA-binding transcriptional accessory protein, partial [Candidatus Electrothrix sp. AR3]|nr:RNA-binding transcriptional accessory protein [Candidatus Electrothrix sp. AR3]
MQPDHQHIAQELKIAPAQVAAAAQLLAEGATVPFISRYRKELTGSLDEVQITAVRDQLANLAALAKRRQTMLDSLAKRELLTNELQTALQGADNLTSLADIFLPYQQKRKT